MSPQEIIGNVQLLPIEAQREILAALQQNLSSYKPAPVSEDEIEQALLAKGLIGFVPQRVPDDEEESYVPIEVIGKPLSETILEERE